MIEVSATKDIKKANNYLSMHRGDFARRLEERSKKPENPIQHRNQLRDTRNRLKRAAEAPLRDFNLQLVGAIVPGSVNGDTEGQHYHPLNSDSNHVTDSSPLSPLEDSLREELASPRTIEDPETGQKFTALMLNWQKTRNPDVPVLLTEPGFNNTAEPHWWNGVTTYKSELVARMTDLPVLVIDHPHMGSEPLTRQQKEALASKDDYVGMEKSQTLEDKLRVAERLGYGQVAQAQIRAIEALGLENDFIGFGGSMGGWSMAKLVEIAALREQIAKKQTKESHTNGELQPNESAQKTRKPIHFKKLLSLESPGVRELTPLELAQRFLTEGKLHTFYKTPHADPIARRSTMQRAPLWKQIAGKLHEAYTIFAWDPGNVYKIAMGRPTLQTTLATALEANTNLEVQILFGSESLLSPREETDSMIADLKQAYPGKVQKTVIPGETHLIMENPKRYAAWVRMGTRPLRKSAT